MSKILHSLFLSIILIIISPLLIQATANIYQNGTGQLTGSLLIDHRWDSLKMVNFFDEVFNKEMQKRHVPGATFTMVRDGKLIFKRGYGYACTEEQKPVIADRTIFFAGSVSKLFTATAIMQLFEQGKVDLNTDVNEYLSDLEIDQNFPGPVTITNLLTHTGGFEERSLYLASFTRANQMTPYEYLSLGNQPRVLPQGKYLSYSNYGFTLLGYIVEQVSGMPFSKYIDSFILKPLEMDKSSFAYPEILMEELATAYIYKKGRFRPLPVLYVNVIPAGALLTTSTNMANFMIAHLQNGIFSDTSILKPQTAELMHSQLFTQHPRLEGWCHAFYENFINDRRLIQHAGDINGYGSLMVLIPEENTGFFVSINGGEGMGMGFREKLSKRIMDHFYPAEVRPVAAQSVEADLSRIRGVYRLNRYSRLSVEKLAGIMMEGTIEVNDDHSLTMTTPAFLRKEPSSWEMIDPMLFRNPDDSRFMSFMEDDKGRITHMNMFLGIPGNMEKIAWYGNHKFNIPLIISIILLTLTVIPGWQLAALARSRRRKRKRMSIIENRAYKTALTVAGINLFFIIGTGISMALTFENSFGQGLPFVVRIFFILPFISAFITLILLWFNFQVWRFSLWSIFRRSHYTLFTIASILFIWFLYYWNILGFKF